VHAHAPATPTTTTTTTTITIIFVWCMVYVHQSRGWLLVLKSKEQAKILLVDCGLQQKTSNDNNNNNNNHSDFFFVCLLELFLETTITYYCLLAEKSVARNSKKIKWKKLNIIINKASTN
jgi:hypothetical protein